jgi:hypothetical protein
MKVLWTGKPALQIKRGDKIQILSGFGNPENGHIRATRIRNQTTSNLFESDVYGILTTKRPKDFTPIIVGYAKAIMIHGSSVTFELEETAPPTISNSLRECERFIDPKLYWRCKDKDYHDVLMNAFPILEDRIRAKTDVSKEYSGQPLINHALNPTTGKLTLGEIPSEQESIYLLFKGAIGFLRNPTSHSLTEDESDIESFEIMCMVDLLLRFVKKAKLRS